MRCDGLNFKYCSCATRVVCATCVVCATHVVCATRGGVCYTCSVCATCGGVCYMCSVCYTCGVCYTCSVIMIEVLSCSQFYPLQHISLYKYTVIDLHVLKVKYNRKQ